MTPSMNLLIGLLISSLVGWLAYRRRSLNESGVAGLLLFGGILSFFGGWVWLATMLAFLISSSLWTLFRHGDKKYLDDIVAKTGPRDIVQAAANVGMAGSAALLFWLSGESAMFVLFLGALASVNADTWATELGSLSRTWPRLITTWQRVSPGTSGGVTGLGTLSGLAGSFFIAGLGTILMILDTVPNHDAFLVVPLPAFLAAALGGFIGLVSDSLLGATVQVKYYCRLCDKVTEQQVHRGQHVTEYLGGVHWINNDVVNFLSSLIGGSVAYFVYLLL